MTLVDLLESSPAKPPAPADAPPAAAEENLLGDLLEPSPAAPPPADAEESGHNLVDPFDSGLKGRHL